LVLFSGSEYGEFECIQMVNGASTGNVWQRTEDDCGGCIYLSKRSRT